ncbi:hypothetical protein CEUSTIGMA_g2869.t1 [Chlamydomonas eustigma]|uniref:Uncharacterized protein n=1 Tax=Chlamydomonas eustigma TaxID=1157962 RepID=A0A250WXB1_9CHLO|nr:hypothetical protein CEUSTIGMA_g2869.t1 [Chlamydomonas eustigma]|eukprot:GAX75425.1 hypothetical protein CEUSTIGMA_g2869.t1 [Chlamydomonas eustigma]
MKGLTGNNLSANGAKDDNLEDVAVSQSEWPYGNKFMVYNIRYAAWYLAKSIRFKNGFVQVRYCGWGAEEDELINVMSDRFDFEAGGKRKWRPIQGAAGAFSRGEVGIIPTGTLLKVFPELPPKPDGRSVKRKHLPPSVKEGPGRRATDQGQGGSSLDMVQTHDVLSSIRKFGHNFSKTTNSREASPLLRHDGEASAGREEQLLLSSFNLKNTNVSLGPEMEAVIMEADLAPNEMSRGELDKQCHVCVVKTGGDLLITDDIDGQRTVEGCSTHGRDERKQDAGVKQQVTAGRPAKRKASKPLPVRASSVRSRESSHREVGRQDCDLLHHLSQATEIASKDCDLLHHLSQATEIASKSQGIKLPAGLGRRRVLPRRSMDTYDGGGQGVNNGDRARPGAASAAVLGCPPRYPNNLASGSREPSSSSCRQSLSVERVQRNVERVLGCVDGAKYEVLHAQQSDALNEALQLAQRQQHDLLMTQQMLQDLLQMVTSPQLSAPLDPFGNVDTILRLSTSRQHIHSPQPLPTDMEASRQLCRQLDIHRAQTWLSLQAHAVALQQAIRRAQLQAAVEDAQYCALVPRTVLSGHSSAVRLGVRSYVNLPAGTLLVMPTGVHQAQDSIEAGGSATPPAPLPQTYSVLSPAVQPTMVGSAVTHFVQVPQSGSIRLPSGQPTIAGGSGAGVVPLPQSNSVLSPAVQPVMGGRTTAHVLPLPQASSIRLPAVQPALGLLRQPEGFHISPQEHHLPDSVCRQQTLPLNSQMLPAVQQQTLSLNPQMLPAAQQQTLSLNPQMLPAVQQQPLINEQFFELKQQMSQNRQEVFPIEGKGQAVEWQQQLRRGEGPGC